MQSPRYVCKDIKLAIEPVLPATASTFPNTISMLGFQFFTFDLVVGAFVMCVCVCRDGMKCVNQICRLVDAFQTQYKSIGLALFQKLDILLFCCVALVRVHSRSF